MTRHLLDAGYDVIGMDTGYFDQCTFTPDLADVPTIDKDIRDLVPEDLQSLFAVIHLAALSNDPIGNLDEGWTEEINYRASARLAELAREAEVRRFLFSSSCIMYGMSSAEEVDEDSPLEPQTEYARSKVKAERSISALAADGFSPVFLRNGTVYGISPRMRFDTVFNNLMGSAFSTGKITVHSDGKPWRPVVHVEDVARAFIAVLQAPTGAIHDQAFNTRANHLNHQVIELAEIAAAAVPDCDLEVQAREDADQRTYKANFDKFARTFPGFEFRWDAKAGAQDLYEGYRRVGLTEEMFTDDRFTRLSWLNRLLRDNQLDASLRWTNEKTGRT